MLNRIGLTALIITLLSSTLTAQTPGGLGMRLQMLYEDFKFQEVISSGRYLLQNSNVLSESDTRLIHEYMAISFFTIGETDSAHKHFYTLLTMDHDHTLDPIRTSPKILDFYTEIKTEFNLMYSQNRLQYVDRYMFIEDLRPAAAWRSALLPGWGQIYKHQPVKGYIFGGTFFTGLIVTAGALIKENDYRDKYLNSNDPAEISDLYDRYNSWSKIRRAAMYTTAVIWLLNISDAIWADYPRLGIEQSTSDRLSLSLSYKF